MPRLYLHEYGKNLVGRKVCIACREGILRDHFKEIVDDIKFLVKHKTITTVTHNLPNRLANKKLMQDLARRLPATKIYRIAPELNFYEAVLQHPDTIHKLILLERHYLKDNRGNKINTLTTEGLRSISANFGDFIANVNFKDTMNRLCEKIEMGHYDRIHILPAGKNTIKYELFTVEGTGTMLANNFVEEFRQVRTDEEVALVHRILTIYKSSGFLRPRTKEYLSRNRNHFFVTTIDEIVVGCIEQKAIDRETVELGALAISTRFRSQRIGVHTVNSFIQTMADQGVTRFIALTNNPRLQELLRQLEFVDESKEEYGWRQDKSPGVKMFFKKIDKQ